jgi:hypothetical protein
MQRVVPGSVSFIGSPKRAVHGGRKERHEVNTAPSQWSRRLARAVGARFGAQMVLNQARNEGQWQGLEIAIKCAKSVAPPISVLVSMLDRLDEVWAVFVLPSGAAEVWRVPIARLRRHGYFTRPGRSDKASARVEIRRRKVMQCGTLLGVLDPEEVHACRIP